MKVQLLIVVGTIASLLLLPSSAGTSTTLYIDKTNTCPDNCYVITDPIFDIVTLTADDEIIPREQPMPFTSQRDNPRVNVPAELPVCWRLDYGNLEDFDWNVIRTALSLFHGVDIGLALRSEREQRSREIVEELFRRATRHWPAGRR